MDDGVVVISNGGILVGRLRVYEDGQLLVEVDIAGGDVVE